MKEIVKTIINTLFSMFLIFTWILGIVIAKGFWSTLFAFFPFYAWYLVTEFIYLKWLL